MRVPRAQASYRMAYQVAFQPTFDSRHYRRLYYQLQWDVDCEMLKVLAALDLYGFAEDTIVVFTVERRLESHLIGHAIAGLGPRLGLEIVARRAWNKGNTLFDREVE